ncbi:hypothetical protein ACQRIT_001829 [Beauveria bassiana]
MSIPTTSTTPWSVAGKTAIVTGGSRGIGRAIAIHLARKGISKVAITYASNVKAAEATLEQLRILGVRDAAAIRADALDPNFASIIVSEVFNKLDTKVVDILVNNAVLTDHAKLLPIKEATLENFLEVMQGNVYAPLSLATKLLPYLPEYGGRVINISSALAYQGTPDPFFTYGASKAALQAYTRSLADAFGKQTKATFNSVVVGPTDTDSVKLSQEFLDALVRDTTAADRIGVPDDIAYIVGFLSSEEGRWINGAAISANGGSKAIMPALG